MISPIDPLRVPPAAPSNPSPETVRPVPLAPAGAPTIIGENLSIVGKFRSRGRAIVNGTIDGEVHCQTLVVSETGTVIGKIVAEDVQIYGKVVGNVYGTSVELFAIANVTGDIFHHGIGIERGTRYDGALRFVEDPLAEGAK